MALLPNSPAGPGSRFRSIQIAPRGTLGDGKEPAVGSGGIVPLQVLINPTYQTANALTVTDQAGNVLFAVDATGAIATGPTASTGLVMDGVAHVIYNFAVDGGAIGTITPAVNATIPANAIITGATINPTTAVTSAGSATVAVGTVAGSSASSILGATGKASLTVDALINGAVTLAAPVKMSAAGQVQLTVATAALTAGVIEIFVYYVVAKNS